MKVSINSYFRGQSVANSPRDESSMDEDIHQFKDNRPIVSIQRALQGLANGKQINNSFTVQRHPIKIPGTFAIPDLRIDHRELLDEEIRARVIDRFGLDKLIEALISGFYEASEADQDNAAAGDMYGLLVQVGYDEEILVSMLEDRPNVARETGPRKRRKKKAEAAERSSYAKRVARSTTFGEGIKMRLGARGSSRTKRKFRPPIAKPKPPKAADLPKDEQGAFYEGLLRTFLKEKLPKATIQGIQKKGGQGIDIALLIEDQHSCDILAHYTPIKKFILVKPLICHIEVKTNVSKLSAEEQDPLFFRSKLLEAVDWTDSEAQAGSREFAEELRGKFDDGSEPIFIELLARVYTEALGGARVWFSPLRGKEDNSGPGLLLLPNAEIPKTWTSGGFGNAGEDIVCRYLQEKGFITPMALQKYEGGPGVDYAAIKDEVIYFFEVKRHHKKGAGQDGLSVPQRAPGQFVAKHLLLLGRGQASIDEGTTAQQIKAFRAAATIISILSKGELDPATLAVFDLEKLLVEKRKRGEVQFKLIHVNAEPSGIEEVDWGVTYWEKDQLNVAIDGMEPLTTNWSDGANFTVGRDSSNNIRIPGSFKTVSKNHFQLKKEGGNTLIKDISTNGTWVNNIRIKKGDWVPISLPVTLKLASGAINIKLNEIKMRG